MTRVAKEVYPAEFAVIPVDRGLNYIISPETRNIEDLDIEAPSLKGASAEEVMGNFAPQAFKTALRIVDALEDKQLDHAVKYPPDYMSKKRFIITV
jgi:hypothetical protein